MTGGRGDPWPADVGWFELLESDEVVGSLTIGMLDAREAILRMAHTARELARADFASFAELDAAHTAAVESFYDAGDRAGLVKSAQGDRKHSTAVAYFLVMGWLGVADAALERRIEPSWKALSNQDGAMAALAHAGAMLQEWSAGRPESAIASQGARISKAQKAANVLHSTGPKAKAKVFVKECWQAWQAHPERYAGPTEFARDMLEKQPVLESDDVIMRWCRKWNGPAARKNIT